MTRAGLIIAIALSTPVFGTPAAAQQDLQKMINWCLNKNKPTPQQRIQGCTAAINAKRFKGEVLAGAYQNRALAYLGLNKIAEAAKDAEETVRLAPRVPAAHLALGVAREKQGRLEEAIASASFAISLDARATLAYYNRGNLYFLSGQHDKALADFDKAISIDPKYLPAYNNRALTKLELKRFDDALADAAVTITLIKPSDPKPYKAVALVTRAKVYNAMKKYDLALKDVSAAIVLAPTAEHIRARIGLYDDAGKPEAGLPDVEQLIKLDPNDSLAWNSRCWIHAIVGKLEEALADCNKSIALAPGQPHALDSRAFIHLKMGKYSEAITDYNEALKLSGYETGGKIVPAIAIHLYGRGLAREKNGDMLGGTVDMTQAKAVSPDLPDKFAIYLKQ